MVCIWEKFRAAIHKDVSLKTIWEHLESMYDLMALVLIVTFYKSYLLFKIILIIYFILF